MKPFWNTITNYSTILVLFFSGTLSAFGQDYDGTRTFSPYTLYGFGELSKSGFAYHKAMGSIMTAVQDRHTINVDNPAANGSVDSTKFILDLGIESQNIYSSNANSKTAYNSLNFNHLALLIPIRKNMAISLGVVPFSSIGYNIVRKENRPEILANAGNISYEYVGEGSVNQVFLNYGIGVFKGLNLGISGKYYFGNLNRFYNVNFDNALYFDNHSYRKNKVSGFSFNVGAQYSIPIATNKQLVIGATFQPGLQLGSTITNYSYVNGSMINDTISPKVGKSFEEDGYSDLPMKIEGGLWYNVNTKWNIGLDYAYQNWSNAKVGYIASENNIIHNPMSTFHQIRLGGSYTPNLFDLRYFMKRITYRAGFRYTQIPYTFSNKQVDEGAFTVGFGVPLKGFAYANLAGEVGQRGLFRNAGIKETFFNITLSITFYDFWYLKFQYQ